MEDKPLTPSPNEKALTLEQIRYEELHRDDPTAREVFTVLLLVVFTIGGLVLIGIGIAQWANHGRRAGQKLLAGGLACIAGYLWIPWLIFFISQSWRWSNGKVNDLERKEIVTPPTDVIRPSKAEPHGKEQELTLSGQSAAP